MKVVNYLWVIYAGEGLGPGRGISATPVSATSQRPSATM